MCPKHLLLLAALIALACAPPAPPAPPAKPSETIPAPKTALDPSLAQGKRDVEAFFGSSFPAPYEPKIFPSRAAFSAYAKQRWGMPSTECWMVAMGVASVLIILSPDAWKTDACEHDPTDARRVQQILTHELVHVFHGQRCASPEFDGMDDLGWFVEGLAILAAGQLDDARRKQAGATIAAGKVPSRLAEIWSGPARYALAASLVEHVDRTYGRARVVELLRATKQDQILAALGTTEQALLAAWRAATVSVAAPSPAP